jgi:hypothetical protein
VNEFFSAITADNEPIDIDADMQKLQQEIDEEEHVASVSALSSLPKAPTSPIPVPTTRTNPQAYATTYGQGQGQYNTNSSVGVAQYREQYAPPRSTKFVL